MDLDDFELAAFDLLEGGDKRTAAQDVLDDLESAAWGGLDLHKRNAATTSLSTSSSSRGARLNKDRQNKQSA